MSLVRLWTGAPAPDISSVVLPALPQEQGFSVHAFADGDQVADSPPSDEGDIILAMGAGPYKLLQQGGAAPKNRSLDSMRGQVLAGTYMVSYSPAIVHVDHGKLSEVQWDVRLASRYVTTGTLAPELGNYEYVTDFGAHIEYVENQFALTGQRWPVTMDLETTGLYPYVEDTHIVSIALSVMPGFASVIRFEGPTHKLQPACRVGTWHAHESEAYPTRGRYLPINSTLREQIQWLCESEKVALRGANFKFDMGWMWWHWGIERYPAFTMDTLLVGSLQDESRSNSLNTHAKIFTPLGGYDDEFNRKHNKAKMEDVPPSELLPYAGGDTVACLRASGPLIQHLSTRPRLARFYVNLLHPATKAFTAVEQRGVVVDFAKYQQVRGEIVEAVETAETKALSALPKPLFHKYEGAGGATLTKSALISDFMFSPWGLNLKPQILTQKTQKPSTAMNHLEMFSDHPDAGPWVALLKEYNSAKKTLGTFVDGFLKHLRPDGRFHPTYMQYHGVYGNSTSGTVTGRTSAKDPAWQTLPQHTKWAKKLRECFVAPEGYIILAADYSQGELRITACIANEPTMIQAYREGIDLHAITASVMREETLIEFLALPKDEIEYWRRGGKAGNFGLIYGMSAVPGFQNYAWDVYGLKMTEMECEAFKAAFFGKYKGLVGWHNNAKAHARKYKMIESPLGRIRHLPLINSKNPQVRSEAERQAINSPVQSTLSDLSQLAMATLHREHPQLWCFGMTHDALYFYVPLDNVDEWAKVIKHHMENLPLSTQFGWTPQLPFPVDLEVGFENLAHKQKIEL